MPYIVLSTTTSTQDSGLLEYILPDFTKKTGLDVRVVAVGTGKAIQMGIDGEADVLLVHSEADEEKFVSDGHGVKRFAVMHNDFVLVGPEGDPAGVALDQDISVGAALNTILQKNQKLISRGDNSGTHKKELKLWADEGVEPSGDNYISAGKGMGDVLQMADEMQGYTLTDRATFLNMRDKLSLKIVKEGDEGLLNPYGVIAVNPDKNDQINEKGAQAFVDWIISDETQKLIGRYGVEKFGQALFFPDGDQNK